MPVRIQEFCTLLLTYFKKIRLNMIHKIKPVDFQFVIIVIFKVCFGICCSSFILHEKNKRYVLTFVTIESKRRRSSQKTPKKPFLFVCFVNRLPLTSDSSFGRLVLMHVFSKIHLICVLIFILNNVLIKWFQYFWVFLWTK